LPKFNLVGDTLIGATIYFYAQENVNTLTLTNTASGVETFTFLATSNATSNSSNSANNADKFGTETLTLFSQSMILGGSGTGPCPESTPSSSCSSVSFTPPSLTATNLTVGFPVGTGVDSLTGVTKNIMGADLANYIGAGSFTLGGSSKSFTSFSGGGNNINPSIATTAQFSAEIDYTYTVPTPPSSTPEPATMALTGSGFLGLAWLLRRRRKEAKS
jgi:hypothetical protein